MAKVADCRECSTPFEVNWGNWRSLEPRRRLYCSRKCSQRNFRKRRKANAKLTGCTKKRDAYNKRARANKGRMCKWAHCQVDDENHISFWGSSNDTCPSCSRQVRRMEACAKCSGPQYRDSTLNALRCPNCEPRQPQTGEILVVLLCSATDRERELLRRPDWKLPDGRKLRDAHEEGILVLDLAPKVWAKYRF